MLFIITTTVPKPVKTYINREDALATIAALLKNIVHSFFMVSPVLVKVNLLRITTKHIVPTRPNTQMMK